MIPFVEKVERPEIGRVYLVRCVWFGPYYRSPWLPIIGPLHEDADIGMPSLHYHYDLRFFTQWQYERKEAESFSPVISRVHVGKAGEEKIISIRRKRMWREMPVFPTHGPTGNPGEFIIALEKQFLRRKMDCRTCPHRGMPLDQLPREGDLVVCNGHGLRWNTRTGRLAPRLIKGAP